MQASSTSTGIGTAKTVLWNLILLGAGSALCAVSINGILIPHKFLSGGFVGLALVTYYLFPLLSVPWLYFLFNVPLFALGWLYVGRRFFLYSLAGTIIFTVAVRWVDVSLPVQDPILAALLAGIIGGAGAGIILRSFGSAGGVDILSVILLQRFSIRLGSTILGFNALVLSLAAVFFSLEAALYALIYMYVVSYVVNLVVTGWSQRKAVLIISPKWEQIHRGILYELRRGATIIQGRGAYSDQSEQILYTVITFRELARLKRMIQGMDPHAFVVVTDTVEVMGLRVGTQPHW
jgi:uncharacterized membrane-anchored protein YitT (DUF2179 family)